MRIVIADTGPLNYLLLIGHVDLLPRLFEAIHIPVAVRDELSDAAAPQIVRDWIATPPPWLQIRATQHGGAQSMNLDAGEEAAIALALDLKAHVLLIDERAGVKVALAQGFEVFGTLGVIDRAAAAGLINVSAVLALLTATNFRVRPHLIEDLLAKYPATN